MKSIKYFLERRGVNEYIFCNAVMCDKNMSDVILSTIDTDEIPSGIMKRIQKLILNNTIDKIKVCWKNNSNQTYGDIREGTIIDINGQIFICTGGSDGIDEDELFNRIYKNKDWAKNSMSKNGYVITPTKMGFTRMQLNEKDIKKLTEKYWE